MATVLIEKLGEDQVSVKFEYQPEIVANIKTIDRLIAASGPLLLESNSESELNELEFEVREKTNTDMEWIILFLKEHWGSKKIISRGKVYDPKDLPGFIAMQKGKPIGILLYNIVDNQCEIVLLESFIEKIGVGSTLIEYTKQNAIKNNCKRLWLITTNNNINAIRFYQLRDFMMVAVYRNAMEESRKLKPEIPLKGQNGIPIRDEIEFEMILY